MKQDELAQRKGRCVMCNQQKQLNAAYAALNKIATADKASAAQLKGWADRAIKILNKINHERGRS